MCRLSKEMEKNGDEISNISSVDNQVMKDNHDRADIIKDKDMQEELPMELQQALHLTSGSDANSLQANSNNSSRESFTSSPDQSAEHYHQQLLNTHGHNHNHNNDHNLEAEGHNLVGNNSCNSTHIYNNMLIADEVCSSTPFFLPKSAWPASKSSLDEPIFFSSSILNSSHIPDPSSMSNSMPKATPTLHSLANLPAENMQQRTLPFYHHTNNTLQFIEGGYHHIPYDHNASNMNDPEYPYSSMPSYSSYLISPYLQPEKINHVDFLSGDGTADCGLYQSQYLQGDDQTSYMEYHNISQAQNWHNVMQQDGHEGACTSYWTPTSHGMIPVMPISHPSNYALNSIDLQAELHFNVQQGGHIPMLSHSQSLPIYLNHFGTQQSMINLANPTNHIAQNNGSPTEGLGSFLTASTLNELSGCRNQLRKPNCKDSSCASAVEEDQEAAGQELSCEGGGANYWKMQQGMKGMPKPSNKRQSPDEEEDDLHDCAPPLKRSASWNCMQSYNNTSPTIDPTLKPYEGSCKTSPKQDKPRARQGIANDPQSIAARHRRERISERLKILQQLVPNGSKVDLVTMLEKAINYVKFLQLQVKVLATDEYWPTPLNKFPKVAAMTMLAESKEPTNMENVGKALETLVET